MRVYVYVCAEQEVWYWSILVSSLFNLQEVEYSFVYFFEQLVKPRLPSSSTAGLELNIAKVGLSKDKLDSVDLELIVAEVAEVFGKFVQFFVKSNDESVVPPAPVSVNAFQILMRSQRTLQSGEHYPNQVQERTKKDKLLNDLLLKAKEQWLNRNEVHTFGVRLLKTIRDVLWYIDESYHLFSQRSTGIPQIFHTFTGYNVPEKSKHRKRVTNNVSSDR